MTYEETRPATLADLAAEKARADDLSRTVAAMGEVITEMLVRHALMDGAYRVCSHCGGQVGPGRRVNDIVHADACVVNAARAILSRPDVTAERGRWVSVEKYAAAMAYRDDRDAAIARAEKAEASMSALHYAFHHAPGEWVPRAELDALGFQLAAKAERLRLAMAVVDEARKTVAANWRVIDVAILAIKLAALDAVPGDVLGPPCMCAELSGRCPKHGEPER